MTRRRASLDELIDEHIDAYFRVHPDRATEKGYARYDERAPRYDDDEIDRFRRSVERARAAVDDVDEGALRSDAAMDLAALKASLKTATFSIDELRWHENNPLFYLSPALEGIDNLDLREDLDPKARERALRKRLHGIGPLLEEARRRIRAPVDAYRDVAVEMLEGALEAFGERFAEGNAAPSTVEAADAARRAMGDYLEHLVRESADARPFSPMGSEAYGRLLRDEHLLEGGVEPLLALARATIDETNAAIAAHVAAGGDDDEAAPPPPGFSHRDVLAYYQEELALVRRFLVEHEVLTLPRAKVAIVEPPEYMRALVQGPSYQPPPAFSPGKQGTLFIQPIPREMDDDDRLSYWERVRERRFRNAVAHEVWPGHHVQLTRAALHPRPVRKFRDNDVMVEGWGLYSEVLVRELGLWGDTRSIGPLYAVRFRACRVVVDICIHTGAMTLAQAVDWMTGLWGAERRPFLEKEVRRYAAEPTQAMSYLVGQKLIMDLREEYRDHVGARRFSLKDFHDRFLAEGSLPVALIRRRMLESAPGKPRARRARPRADARQAADR